MVDHVKERRVVSRARRFVLAVASVTLLATVTASCTTSPDPTAPRGVWAYLTAVGFDLSWEPYPDAERYELRYADLDAAEGPISVETTDTTVELTGLEEGHEYKFNVRAFRAGEFGGWSETLLSTFVVPVLPAIWLDTANRATILRETYVDGTFELDAGGGATPITVATEVRGRGHTTWAALKKPYRIKLDTSTPILGMPSSRHWALLADYFDPTHLRNQTALQLGGQTGLAWTPRARQVELVLNGVYQGVYQIVEHIRVDPDRVDIDEMGAGDTSGDALTGGYLAEIDNYPPGPGDVTFLSTRNQRIKFQDPDPPTAEQFEYLRGYVGAFETALYSPTFTDPSTGYAASLDVESMVDYYLVQELVRNQDAFLGSTYFFKPRLGKMAMGPLWDFDNSMGNNRGWDTGSATGWFVRRPDLKWIGRLFDDPAFVQAVADRWDELKPVIDQLPAQILADGAAIETAMEHERLIWTYRPSPVDTPAKLAAWMQERIDWIDANIHPAP